jgi:hypothetical protein
MITTEDVLYISIRVSTTVRIVGAVLKPSISLRKMGEEKAAKSVGFLLWVFFCESLGDPDQDGRPPLLTTEHVTWALRSLFGPTSWSHGMMNLNMATAPTWINNLRPQLLL